MIKLILEPQNRMGGMIMTNDQKEAIKVLMSLYNKDHIDEEQYFLLLDFIVSDTRNEIKISEYPWNDNKLPNMPITVMYGCGTDVISYDSANTNKIKGEQQ